MSTHKETHRSADLNYAAYLKVAGVPFLGIERAGRRTVYIFEGGPNIEGLRLEYFNRQAKVVALDYVDEIKAMRTLSYTD